MYIYWRCSFTIWKHYCVIHLGIFFIQRHYKQFALVFCKTSQVYSCFNMIFVLEFENNGHYIDSNESASVSLFLIVALNSFRSFSFWLDFSITCKFYRFAIISTYLLEFHALYLKCDLIALINFKVNSYVTLQLECELKFVIQNSQ